jgi:hypothetical protein
VRRAYGFFRKGLILEAARALSGATVFAYEVDEVTWERLRAVVPSKAWRGSLLVKNEDIIEERPGEAALFLDGSERGLEEMPMIVLSGIGLEPEGHRDFHETLWVTEKLLKMEPLKGSLEDYVK